MPRQVVLFLLLCFLLASSDHVKASGGFGELEDTLGESSYSFVSAAGEERSVLMNVNPQLLSTINAIQASISAIASKNDYAFWVIIIQVVATIIAFGLGLAGILRVERLIYYPEFEILTSRPGALNGVKVAFTDKNTGNFQYFTYYFGFRVINSGKDQMDFVEVIVDEVHKKENDDKYHKVLSFLPQNLIWSNTDHVITMPIIQSKFYKHCDFGHIVKSENVNLAQFKLKYESKILFILDTQVQPNTGSSILEPGEYKIKILFAASRINTLPKWYEVKIADKWDEDEQVMLTENVFITESGAP